jgi:hypothetical protein
MKRESEKEWYFGNADKERSGPYGFHEVCVIENLFVVFSFLFYCCCVFETGFRYIPEAGLKLVILLPQPLKCWDYRPVPSCQAGPHPS